MNINDPDILNRAKTDLELQNILLKQNANLIWSSLKGWIRSGAMEKDDLFQVGALGFLKALERFDASRGVNFGTYAVPFIVGYVQRENRERGHIFRLPRPIYEAYHKVKQLKDEHTPEEIAEKLQIPLNLVNQCLNLNVRRLEETFYQDDGDALTLESHIPSVQNVEEEVINKIELAEIMNRLTDREKEILKLRIEKDLSQHQIAAQIGVSQVQISRTLKAIAQKIKGEKVMQLTQNEETQKTIQAIVDWIKEHPGEEINVTQILKDAGLFVREKANCHTYYKNKALKMLGMTEEKKVEKIDPNRTIETEKILSQTFFKAPPSIQLTTNREFTAEQLAKYLEGIALMVLSGPAERYLVKLEIREV